MPAKPTFSPEQRQIIHTAAKRVWKAKFAWMKKEKDHPGGQEAYALALGVTQQTVSNLLKGTYHPGAAVAAAIANLDGQTLEQLVGDFVHPEPENPTPSAPQSAPESFSNLTTCIAFWTDEPSYGSAKICGRTRRSGPALAAAKRVERRSTDVDRHPTGCGLGTLARRTLRLRNGRPSWTRSRRFWRRDAVRPDGSTKYDFSRAPFSARGRGFLLSATSWRNHGVRLLG